MSKEIGIFGIHIDQDEEKVVKQLLQSAADLNYKVCFEFKFAQKLIEKTDNHILNKRVNQLTIDELLWIYNLI